MKKENLGWSNLPASTIGIGLWGIGGPWAFDDWQAGWGAVDDNEAIRIIHKAMEMGVNLFDTAPNYGCGRSERLFGKAIRGRRQDIIISTKFGYLVNEEKKQVAHYDNPKIEDISRLVKESCEASLERLGTDYIDLFLLHVDDAPLVVAEFIRDILEELVHLGMIRYYGWSTDDVERAKVFAEGEHCLAIQYQMNVLYPAEEMLAFCRSRNLASMIRGPLARGILAGKIELDHQFPDGDHRSNEWFAENWMLPMIPKFKAIQHILTANGRRPSQGALAYLLTFGENIFPIPGARTIQQVEENASTISCEPLTTLELKEIRKLLSNFNSTDKVKPPTSPEV